MKSKQEVMDYIVGIEWESLLHPNAVDMDEGEQAELAALYWVLDNAIDEDYMLKKAKEIAEINDFDGGDSGC